LPTGQAWDDRVSDHDDGDLRSDRLLEAEQRARTEDCDSWVGGDAPVGVSIGAALARKALGDGRYPPFATLSEKAFP